MKAAKERAKSEPAGASPGISQQSEEQVEAYLRYKQNHSCVFFLNILGFQFVPELFMENSRT